MMDANEREVYRAAIHGDREAFEMIIRTHSRSLFAIAYGILQNREEAEDAVQDALVKAWKSRWRVRDPEKFPAWLCMIARHRARDVFRKRRPVPHDLEGAAPLATPKLGEGGSTPTSLADDPTIDLDRQLHSALAALPELHRAAISLRYFEEMDYATIENRLGLTNGSLRGILGRALATMRKQLKPTLASLQP
jgi:RNA polymerase sigma-70 factor, ECF subfamily